PVTPLEVEVTTVQTAFYPGGSALRSSKPLTIEVLPLPAAGQPEGFEATNVGRYDISSAVDNARPKAGGAVTFKDTVPGTGKLPNLKGPRRDRIDGFKVDEPSASDAVERSPDGVHGQKVLTYLLLPRKGGPLTIPKLELPYFDSVEGRYQISVAPAINIAVD